jgi:hypothetical protein
MNGWTHIHIWSGTWEVASVWKRASPAHALVRLSCCCLLLLLSMSDGPHAVAVGRSRGGKLLCPPITKKLLLLDLAGKHWTPDDLLEDGVPAEDRDANDMQWFETLQGILGDQDKEDQVALTPSKAMLVRFQRWTWGPLDALDDPSSKALKAAKAAKKAAAVAEASIVSGDSSDSDDDDVIIVPPTKIALKKKKHAPSAQLLRDVAMHPGATCGEQIIYLSACVYLGRHATREECIGLRYGEHPVSSALIRKNSKISALGMQAITSSFLSARRCGSLVPLTVFFTGTRDKMIAAPDDHCGYAQMGAHCIGTWFDAAVQTAASDLVAIEYLELAVVHWSLNGRGLPDEFDGKLMERAKRLVADADLASSRASACSTSSGSTASLPRSTVPSSSGSVQSDDASIALGEQMGTVLKGIESMSATLTTVGRRLDGTNTKIDLCKSSCDSLATRVKALEGKGGGGGSQLTKEEKDKTIKCNKCEEIGHRGADCPN